MNRFKSCKLIALAFAMTVGFGTIPTNTVNAQGSAALSIPPRKNYTIEPGKGVNDTLLVRNLDTERFLNLSLRVVDFTFNDDGGTPKLMLDENAAQTPWSLKPFIKVPESVTIDPNSSESIDMSVTIPEGQGAGSYYSAIIFSSSASEGGNVGLSASGVSLAFVTVPGEVDEKLHLQKLGAYDPVPENRDGSRGRFKLFNMDMPLRIGYTLNNEGNVAENPVGSITLKNLLFGKETVINDMNPNDSLALIGQTRTFTVCVKMANQEVEFSGGRQEAATCSDDTGLWPGLYRVELIGFYGWNGNATQDIVGKAWMVYTPWWFLIILAVILLLAVYYGWKMYSFIQLKRGVTPSSKKYIARGRR